MEECCQIALIIWLMKVTAYSGTLRQANGLLARSKAAICSLDEEATLTKSDETDVLDPVSRSHHFRRRA